jgi:ABC-type protease/lipase transport system fused ATPase/permease subunit
MRFCKPYLRALRRGLAVSVLLGGVMSAFAAIAASALARLIDARLASDTSSALLPVLLVLGAASFGFCAIGLMRATLHNRRQIWIAHALAQDVAAHEMWTAAEAPERERSLAAVAEIATFTGSSCSRALADAPWVLLGTASLWLIDGNIAAVASGVVVMLSAWAVVGSRRTTLAHNFDASAVKRRSARLKCYVEPHVGSCSCTRNNGRWRSVDASGSFIPPGKRARAAICWRSLQWRWGWQRLVWRRLT